MGKYFYLSITNTCFKSITHMPQICPSEVTVNDQYWVILSHNNQEIDVYLLRCHFLLSDTHSIFVGIYLFNDNGWKVLVKLMVATLWEMLPLVVTANSPHNTSAVSICFHYPRNPKRWGAEGRTFCIFKGIQNCLKWQNVCYNNELRVK